MYLVRLSRWTLAAALAPVALIGCGDNAPGELAGPCPAGFVPHGDLGCGYVPRNDDCSADGWCIESPKPVTTFAFNGSWASGPDDVWLVGDGGAVARHAADGWSRMDVGSAQDLIDVDGTGPDDVWVLGADGLLHWDGTSWATLAIECGCSSDDPEIGSLDSFTSLVVLGPDELWLAGSGVFAEDVCRWDGNRWHRGAQNTSNTCPTPLGCTSLWASAPDDIWCDLSHHFDGEQVVPIEGGEEFFNVVDVWSSGPDDVWALHSTFADSTLVHWDGASFTTHPVPAQLGELHGFAPDDVWAVGQGTAVHWDGIAWTEIELAPGARPTTVVAVGAQEAVFGGFAGRIDRRAGEAWSEESDRLPQPRRLWGAAADDVWIASDGGMVHWDGASFTREQTAGNFGVKRFLGFAADDIYGVGYFDIADVYPLVSGLAHYDGTAWTVTPALDLPLGGSTPETRHLIDVSGVAPDDFWVAGYDGEQAAEAYIAHFDGAAWTRVDTPEFASAMWSGGENDVWIAYYPPTDDVPDTVLAHWDGADWTEYRIEDTIIRSLHGFASDDVWAGGEPAVILHWDGDAWAPVEAPVDSAISILDLWGDAPDDLWASGGSTSLPLDGGAMLHWDGERWTAETLPTAAHVSQVFGVDGEMWALGGYLMRK